MPDDLLDYYNRELTYIRQLAAKFGERYPKIAERLQIGLDRSEDPHVERLIEAFAYLTARIRSKIDDELPEVTSSLLDVLYPHYQAPIPSMAIVQFRLDPEQTGLTSGYLLPRGTELETEPVHGEPCRFRTGYPVTLWPIEVKSAGLVQAPFPAPPVPFTRDASSVLRLVLRCASPESTVSELGLTTLRFFLKGQPHHVYRLYEMIFNNTLVPDNQRIGAVVAGSPTDSHPLILGKENLRPVGFDQEDGLLPYPARSFKGYRLLSEYFAFPQKFLFFDVDLPSPEKLAHLGNQIELYFFFNRSNSELARSISADTFQLGCAPIINLYRQRAEPIAITHSDFEYRVIPDRRLPLAHEIYSIDRVDGSSPQGEVVEFSPFFSIKHARSRAADRNYWHAVRRPAEETSIYGDQGTEVHLSLMDLKFRPSSPANWTMEVETTCLNRDLPHDLPFGGDQPRLQIREGGGLISRITCLTAPTRTLRPALGHGVLWRLISHLNLNHLSLVDDPRADALREILTLYDFGDSAETRNQIDGILSVRSRRVVGAIRSGGPVSFCKGVEVTLQFDEEKFTGSGLFLFASVLERFLALYSNLNSFSKMIATVKGREGDLRRWPPRIGEKVLV
ncbi:MAG: type VI secretion system protein ImpG [Planctomycetes bacterium SCN 63-9]|nr:MAG: type VI secretion system protein ImpG [Planctomycetes bacterium SCN 63-9]